MKKLTTKQYEDFSMGGKVPIISETENDDIHLETGVYVIEDKNISKMIKAISDKKHMKLSKDGKLGSSYKEVEIFFRLICDGDKGYDFKDKNVLIVGTSNGWYEAWVLAYGGTPYVLEYMNIEYDGDRINYIDMKQAKQLSKKKGFQFDYCISFSTFEHSGLGRYGDEIDADGDLKAMEEVRDLLPLGGQMFLAVPIGVDRVVYPMHRIYGVERAPYLFNQWHLKGISGFWWFQFKGDFGVGHQPIFILEKDDEVFYNVNFYKDLIRFGMVSHITNMLDIF